MLQELPAPQVVHLDVSTCALLPVLAVQGEGTSWRAEPGVWEFDFGTFRLHAVFCCSEWLCVVCVHMPCD